MDQLEKLKLIAISAIERVLNYQRPGERPDWSGWREDLQMLRDTLVVLKDEPGAAEAFDKLTGVASLDRESNKV